MIASSRVFLCVVLEMVHSDGLARRKQCANSTGSCQGIHCAFLRTGRHVQSPDRYVGRTCFFATGPWHALVCIALGGRRDAIYSVCASAESSGVVDTPKLTLERIGL